jgi:ubiquinone/menaquinone biosynthesis C-methylase UbiE
MGYYEDDEKEISHEESLLKMNEIVSDTAKLQKGDLVLDAGCGVGGSSIWWAQNRGCKVKGVSLVDNEIFLAQKLSAAKKIDSMVKFEAMDITDLKFDKESFDVVIAIESFCYALDKNNFLKEAFRVLKKGGRLVISDYFSRNGYISSYENNLLIKVCKNLVSIFAHWIKSVYSYNWLDIVMSMTKDVSMNVKKSYDEGIIRLNRLHEDISDPILRVHIDEEQDRNILECHCLNNGLLRYGIVCSKKL